jgi:hypothetical protein
MDVYSYRFDRMHKCDKSPCEDAAGCCPFWPMPKNGNGMKAENSARGKKREAVCQGKQQGVNEQMSSPTRAGACLNGCREGGLWHPSSGKIS